MNMKTINFCQRTIGRDHPTFIIAEIGVNHNGDMELAKKMITAAKKAGADCAKFQTFKAKEVVTQDAPKADYQLETTDVGESQAKMLEALELESTDWKELKALCDELGIAFLSTPYNLADADLLAGIGVDGFKIASGQAVEPFFLDHVARQGKPVFLSTGMCTMAEVDEAVRTIREAGNEEIVVLQCTTNYPSRIQDANLRAMKTMQKAFGLPVGYSDHTRGTTTTIAAVSLGACVVERHFTLDKSLPGPDHSSSMEPDEFAEMVCAVRDTEASLGDGRKEPSEAEKRNIQGMRRSLVATRDLPEGTIITADDLSAKRPATGLKPMFFEHLVGKRTRKHIEKDEFVFLESVG